MKILLKSIITVCLALALTGCYAGYPYYSDNGYYPYSGAYAPYGYYYPGDYYPDYYYPSYYNFHSSHRQKVIIPRHQHSKPGYDGVFRGQRHNGTFHKSERLRENRHWQRDRSVPDRDRKQIHRQQRQVDQPVRFRKPDNDRRQSQPKVSRPDGPRRWKARMSEPHQRRDDAPVADRHYRKDDRHSEDHKDRTWKTCRFRRC